MGFEWANCAGYRPLLIDSPRPTTRKQARAAVQPPRRPQAKPTGKSFSTKQRLEETNDSTKTSGCNLHSTPAGKLKCSQSSPRRFTLGLKPIKRTSDQVSLEQTQTPASIETIPQTTQAISASDFRNDLNYLSFQILDPKQIPRWQSLLEHSLA
jgi:hypothetical protein